MVSGEPPSPPRFREPQTQMLSPGVLSVILSVSLTQWAVMSRRRRHYYPLLLARLLGFWGLGLAGSASVAVFLWLRRIIRQRKRMLQAATAVFTSSWAFGCCCCLVLLPRKGVGHPFSAMLSLTDQSNPHIHRRGRQPAQKASSRRSSVAAAPCRDCYNCPFGVGDEGSYSETLKSINRYRELAGAP